MSHWEKMLLTPSGQNPGLLHILHSTGLPASAPASHSKFQIIDKLSIQSSLRNPALEDEATRAWLAVVTVFTTVSIGAVEESRNVYPGEDLET